MSWKFGILCAGDSELEPFLSHIQNCVVTEKAMLKFYEGKINGVSITALYSGVGKVNAAVAAQILIDTYHVDAVINAGTAGGIHDKIKIFDSVISTQVAYHDMDDDILTEFHPWLASVYFDADEKLLNTAKDAFKDRNSVFFGKMVTGDKFIEDKMRTIIDEKYSPLSVDMETASIAHVCCVNKIPFIAIRTITDTASHDGADSFERNCEQASVISKNMTLEFLKEFNDRS